MSLPLIHTIWTEFNRFLSPADKELAAETLVSILIDNDMEVKDILSEFSGDNAIKQAASLYSSVEQELDDEDDEVEEYDDY